MSKMSFEDKLWADERMDYLENKGVENWTKEDWETFYWIEDSWYEADDE